ncbi:hypothetical protein JXC34_00255 [Candidatus Woesearchaeota archaeon]|nr:hypothetical protein [Candidatus Woesearchaeota archaeon]
MKKNKELIDRKAVLRKKILTLEWDRKRQQINFSRNLQLEEYKKELKELESELECDDS